MRTGGNLFHITHVSQMTTVEAVEATTTTKATFSTPATIQISPWHSPVPYLFGGLAAMLGLIAFALLILACSYWKFYGQVNGETGGARDVEGGASDKEENSSDPKALPIFEDKFLVIMAGDVKPTFLATLKSTRVSLFNDEKINGRQQNDRDEKLQDKDKTLPETGELGESRASHEPSH